MSLGYPGEDYIRFIAVSTIYVNKHLNIFDGKHRTFPTIMVETMSRKTAFEGPIDSSATSHFSTI